MPIAISWVRRCVKPEFFADQVNVRFFACKKEPARTGMILFSVCLELYRRIALRINTDGVKENLFAHPITQQTLYLRQPGCLQRTCIHAVRVDQLNHHHLALEQIIIKMDGRAVLRGQFDIRKIVCPPPCVIESNRNRSTNRKKYRAKYEPKECCRPCRVIMLHGPSQLSSVLQFAKASGLPCRQPTWVMFRTH